MNKKSSFICIINVILIGLLTKIISIASRVILSREIGVEAVSIYSLVNPIFIFLLTLSNFSLPTAISSLVSKYPHKAKKIFLTSIIILLLINLPIIICLFFFDEEIGILLLKNKETSLSIKMLAIVIPMTSISSIIKGYYLGKKEMILTSTSSLIEECARLIATIVITQILYTNENDVKATFFILVMLIGEIVQTSYLVFTSGNRYIKNIAKIKDITNKDEYDFKLLLNISLPLTFSRVITSFTYMLEPILLTSILLSKGFSNDEISLNYGIINSYVSPILTLGTFFSVAISNYLLPNISSLIGKKKYRDAFNIFHKYLLITFIIGLFISLIFFFFGGDIIKHVYHVNFGENEIKILSIPFTILYIETPINITMHALNLSKNSFVTSIICSVIRILSLIILTNIFSVIGVSFAMLISCFLDVLINYLLIIKTFKTYNI